MTLRTDRKGFTYSRAGLVALLGVEANRFIGPSGHYAGLGESALGVSEKAAAAGETLSLIITRSAWVINASDLAFGDLVYSDIDGKAIRDVLGPARPLGRVISKPITSRGTAVLGQPIEILLASMTQAGIPSG